MINQSNAVIHIKDFKIQAVIGTLEHERQAPQDLLVNISFAYDARLAAQSDALGHAVDYAAIHAKVVSRVSATKFFLLERLARFILDIIMEEAKVVSAQVMLEKSGVLPGAKAVSVTMAAERSDSQSLSTTRCC